MAHIVSFTYSTVIMLLNIAIRVFLVSPKPSTIKNAMLIIYISLLHRVFLLSKHDSQKSLYIVKRDVQIALGKTQYILYLFYIVHGESIDSVTSNTRTQC